MASTDGTTYISELGVCLGVAAQAYNQIHPENPVNVWEFSTYDEIYAAANKCGVKLGESDNEFWEKYSGDMLNEKYYDLTRRCWNAADDIVDAIYGGYPPDYGYEVLGRENSNEWPPDFKCGDDYFSLKDDSSILWNTTPKALLPFIAPDLADAIENGDIEYLQGRKLKNNGREAAYDWYLYADDEFDQRTYAEFISATLEIFYEILDVYQHEWDPGWGYGEWWKDDPYDEYGVGVLTDSSYSGNDYIPLDEEGRIFFEDTFGKGCHAFLYDGFDRESYPVTFLGLTQDGHSTVGIIPIAIYFDGIRNFFFNSGSGGGLIEAGWITNRSDTADGEYLPLYEFSVKKNGQHLPTTQGTAAILGTFVTKSDWSPMNKSAAYVPRETMPSTMPHPGSYWEPGYMSEFSNVEMSKMEYWKSRMKLNASDALAFDMLDITAGHDAELISLVFRIANLPYYYVRMSEEYDTVIYRVPDQNEFEKMHVSIADVKFDSDKQNTMMTFMVNGQKGSGAEIEIEFRNKAEYFSGAPNMNVLYNDLNTDLGTVYTLVR